MSNSAPNSNSKSSSTSSPPVPLGSLHQLHIEKLVVGGFGLGRLNGQVVFCDGAIPDETVQIQVQSRRKGVMQAKILDIPDPAESRVDPVCPLVGRCGGCQLQHMRYDDQLIHKQRILEDALRRIGKMVRVDICPPVPSPQPYGYRHVLRMGIGQGKDGVFLGFFEAGTNHLLPVESCFLVNEEFQSILDHLRSTLRSMAIAGLRLVHVEVRWSQREKGCLVIFAGEAIVKKQVERLLQACADIPKIKGAIYECTELSGHYSKRRLRKEPIIRGADHLWEDFDGLRLKTGFQSFLQANWDVFQLLGKTVLTWLGNVTGRRILELYAGTGAFGLTLAKHGAHVLCVEGNPFAIQDAKESIRENKIAGCRVRISSVEAYLPTVQGGAYDVILLDPPRSGLNPTVIGQITALQVPILLYISCDAASLARDVKAFCEKGYEVRRMQPFDMFPQTAHLETLVELGLSQSSTNFRQEKE